MDFQLLNKAEEIKCENDIVEIISPGNTDFFIDIGCEYKQLNAPLYYKILENDFIFRCSVTPEFKTTYDAGCLLVYEREDKWIKFAFENTDLGYPAVVSVVTDDISDDCNGERIEDSEIYLQVVRKADDWCLHYSKNKSNWKMVRYFKYKLNKQIKVGISAQSPLGKGCRVRFGDIEIMKNIYTNIRKAL
jgi:regulation of enolase protein 1 (concanavalin A-like superfamily)